jgi:hypothetical protein
VDSNGRIDGNGPAIDGSSTTMDGGRQWMADGTMVTRRGWRRWNDMSAMGMDRERNSDGQRWTARWQLDGGGRRDGNLTVMDGAMATRRQGTMRSSASAMGMLARPAVGATKANAASKHIM